MRSISVARLAFVVSALAVTLAFVICKLISPRVLGWAGASLRGCIGIVAG
jgi:hypothetical protein